VPDLSCRVRQHARQEHHRRHDRRRGRSHRLRLLVQEHGGQLDLLPGEELDGGARRAADAAPSEIKADFQTFVDAFEPYLKALSDANYDFTKLDVASLSQLSSAKVKAASDHIEQYFVQVCHITTPST
jgi:hypothetical protein